MGRKVAKTYGREWEIGKLCLWVSVSVYLFSPYYPGLFAEVGEKPVCRGQWFVSREGFQAFTGAVCRRAECGGLRSLWRGDHPKGTPVQAACQPSCLLLRHGECLPGSPPRARVDIWIALGAMWLEKVSGGDSTPALEEMVTRWELWYLLTVHCKTRGRLWRRGGLLLLFRLKLLRKQFRSVLVRSSGVLHSLEIRL